MQQENNTSNLQKLVDYPCKEGFEAIMVSCFIFLIKILYVTYKGLITTQKLKNSSHL